MNLNKVHPTFHFLTIHQWGPWSKDSALFLWRTHRKSPPLFLKMYSNPINVHVWNAPISNRHRLLYVRVFSPAAAILENKKTLGMRLAWARKVDSQLFPAKFGPISPLKTIIAFLQCIAYMKIQCLSQHSRCATDTLPILDRQVLMHCRHSTETIATTCWLTTDDQLLFDRYSNDNCRYRTNTSPTL